MNGEAVVLPYADDCSMERLARVAQDVDVDGGTLTDEELLLMSGAGGEPEPHYDAPRLSLLSPEQRTLALATALRVLQARELAEPLPGGGVQLTGLPGVIGEIRSAAELALRVRVDVRAGALLRSVVYRASADLYLTERVTPGGLHTFTFRGLEAQARWLATSVAPDLRGGRSESARSYAAPEDLEVSSEELAAASDVAAVVLSPCAVGDIPATSFHAFSDPDGVQVLQGRRPGTEAITLQRLSAEGLVAFCRDFLSAGGE